MKTLEPARQIPVSPLPSRLVLTAPALTGQGNGMARYLHKGKMMKVDEVSMPTGGPLSVEKPESCKARVLKGRWSWWVFCECGKTANLGSWNVAFRVAYRHVRMSWLLKAVAELARNGE